MSVHACPYPFISVYICLCLVFTQCISPSNVVHAYRPIHGRDIRSQIEWAMQHYCAFMQITTCMWAHTCRHEHTVHCHLCFAQAASSWPTTCKRPRVFVAFFPFSRWVGWGGDDNVMFARLLHACVIIVPASAMAHLRCGIFDAVVPKIKAAQG